MIRFAEGGGRTGDNAALVQRSLRRAGRLLERDADLRSSEVSAEALERLGSAGSSIELVARACELYENRPAVSHRVPGTAAFRTLTYAELWRGIARLATGWQREQIVRQGDFVAIVAFGGPEFLMSEIASVYLGATAVPLQTNMSAAALRAALNETRARCVVCDADQILPVAGVLDDCPSVRTVLAITLDEDLEATEVRLSQARSESRAGGVAFATLGAVQALGRGPSAPIVRARGTNPLRAIVYTSGSTGSPKGAMFPESVYVQKWGPQRARTYPFLPSFPLPIPVSFIFSPLGHQMGSELLAASLIRGGLAYLAVNGDTSRLFEDFRAARPTFIAFVPRVANQIYEDHKLEVGRRSAWSKDPVQIGKTAEEVMAEMRESHLGDRLLAATSASAPITPEVLTFLRACFGVPVYNLMGMTEVGGFLFDGHIRRDNVIDFRLADVPEKGFTAADTPHPRGELLLRTHRQIPGYFLSDDATQTTFTVDGYVRTGDIFERRGPDRLAWVARKTQVFKLAHGKFVNLSQLEGDVLLSAGFIRQAYLYGSSERTYLLAVLVPDLTAMRAHLSLAAEEHPSDEQVRALLREDLLRIARERTLQAFEVPRDFLVELEPFSRANGLVADNNKVSPAKLRERYGPRLEALYETLEGRRVEEHRALRELAPDASVGDRLRKALGAVLGPAFAGEALLGSTFVEIGGDSLNAVALSALLASEWSLDLPVGLVLDRRATIAHLVSYLERVARSPAPHRPTAKSLHAEDGWVRADELRLSRFLTDDEFAAARRDDAPERPTGDAPHTARSRPAAVLLTGAAGFLGRFLLLELLERVPETVARVVCVVRAGDDLAARARIAASLVTDATLQRRFVDLERRGALEVLAGDLILPHLGLPPAVFERLAGEVDVVLHAGALVNHALSYDALFEPNVLGTVEIIRFALRRRVKSVNFVSTVGLAEGLDRVAPVLERETARSLYDARPRGAGLPGHGYTSTKWAAELLLEELHQRFDVPVNVFRSSTIMAHPAYRGQINADDFLSRLWCGLAYAGVGPPSFYAEGSGAQHFDGLPVDFVAGVMVDVALERTRGHHIYHLAAPERAGAASLDSLTTWARDYGLQLTGVDDYDTWYRLFVERLGALEGPRRRQSPLVIAERWKTPRRAGARLDSSSLRARLRTIRQNPEFDFPAVTKGLVFKCLDDLRHLGLL